MQKRSLNNTKKTFLVICSEGTDFNWTLYHLEYWQGSNHKLTILHTYLLYVYFIFIAYCI